MAPSSTRLISVDLFEVLVLVLARVVYAVGVESEINGSHCE